MKHYIDKDALVAEIKRRLEFVEKDSKGIILIRKRDKALYDAYNFLFSFLDTLEVKEVDLEKELGKYLNANDIEFGYQIKLLDFAKHFFELGLKAQKGE